MPTDTFDAIVIGAGPNGLVAANRLADAGWSVLVLEEQDHVGGAVRSDEDVHPGFVHDTFSAFYPLAAASRSVRELHLEDHGLQWTHAPAVLGHPDTEGGWAMLLRDRHDTAAHLESRCAGDGEAWLELCALWDRIGDDLVGSLITPFPPVRHGAALLRRLPAAGGVTLVKELLAPVLTFARARFGGQDPLMLLAGNAGHSDIPPNAPTSAVFGLLMTMLGQTVGFPVPVGGAGALTDALTRRLQSLGGEVRCSARVDEVVVEHGRAVGASVQGQTYGARRAVVATVVAPHLYGGLVAERHLPPSRMRRMRAFDLDPSTVKVDWALDGPVPWAAPPPVAPGTVHVADSIEDLGVALAQLAAEHVPAHPFLLAGQMTTSDPTRSPAGTESLWAYTHVPQVTRGDAGEGGIRGTWDADDCERFADRMQDRFERLAPGFGSRVLARRVLGPRELEARDANLVGGAINGGTSQLHQELVLRPVPGLGRAETGVPGLYLGSASAHPGGGVHGAPGMNAARAALAHDRARRLVHLRR